MKTTTFALLALFACARLSAATILSRAHTDVGIAYEKGALDPHVHAHAYDLEYPPDGAVLRVLPTAQDVVPASPAFSFLGSPGDATWILPQDEGTAEAKDLLFLGIGAEELVPSDFQGDLTMSLTNVDFTPEPGGLPSARFTMFSTSGPTPTVLMSTHDGIGPEDTISVVPGSHFHMNWAFSQPGRYEVSYHISATLANGTPKTADATYTFVVKSFASPQGTQLAKNEVVVVGPDFALVSRIAPLSVAPDGGGLCVVGIKGFGASATSVNKDNDTILAHVANYQTTVIAQEGEEIPGIPGSRLRAFNDGFITATGQSVFSAMLLAGAGGVSNVNDAIILARVYDPNTDSYSLATIAREGGLVPGMATFAWKTFLSYLPGDDGSVIVLGVAQDPATKVSKTVAMKATPSGLGYSFAVLVSTRDALRTDSGLHIVKSIARPTRPGGRAVDAAGGVELLLGLDDGTNEIVRFPNFELP